MSFIGDIFGGGGTPEYKNNLREAVSEQQARDVFQQQQNAFQQQRNFVSALQAASPNIFSQQQALANQLQQQAMGQGPNPALAQLAQTTGQNVAGQAALMAGQRGAGVNPALIARMAAQQGGAINQQASGQAATLAAQQQLASQQALAQQQAQIAGQQAGGLQGLNQAALAGQQNVYNALGNQNQAQTAMAGVQQQQRGQTNQLGAGLLGGVGSALGLANGGMVPTHGPRSQLCMQMGGKVPGVAQHAGDNLKNDTVPAMLSPGEIVIPRSVIQAKDAPKAAAAFVKAVLEGKK